MLADQAPRDVEAEARALADGLGGEERIEDALDQLLRHTGPVVHDAHDDRVAVGGRAHIHPPRVGGCFDRVVDQIRPDLIEVAAEALDLG